jgi:Fe2+ or Zn2+ uptake regulation protein
MTVAADDKVDYKDYIDFTPKVIKRINSQQYELVEKYMPIIRALREKPMTVKEIHDLYYNEKKGKHKYTIKTIYRYLDELEEEKLVTVAGHRVTEGSRVYEKLYTRTARIFFKEIDEAYKKHKENYYQHLISQLHTVFSILYDKPASSSEKLEEILLPFFKGSHAKGEELMNEIENNPKLAEFYSELSIDDINSLNLHAGLLMAFIEQPEILEQLRSHFL